MDIGSQDITLNPRNTKYEPDEDSFPIKISQLKSARWTMIAKENGKTQTIQDDWRTACPSGKAEKAWKGKTMFKIRKQFREQESKATRKVRFNAKPKVIEHEVDCIAYSHIKDRSKPAKVYTTDKCPKSSPEDTKEAIKCAESLQAMVKSMLASKGEMPKGQFVCDHDPVGPHDLCCSISVVKSTEMNHLAFRWYRQRLPGTLE